jgi:hypothetical protein
LAPFFPGEKRSFAKTGSGQARGKGLTGKRGGFLSAQQVRKLSKGIPKTLEGKKTVFSGPRNASFCVILY